MALEFTILRTVYHRDGRERFVTEQDFGNGFPLKVITDHIPGVYTPNATPHPSTDHPEEVVPTLSE